jgi:Fe-S cluster biogenesis protein NfuA
MTEDQIQPGDEGKMESDESGNDFEKRVNEALEQIRPMLAMDGGGIELVSADAEKKTVAVRLVGACHGCAGAQMTLQYGVERALREKIPELEEMQVV